jgi:hypothetical protein
VDKGKCDIMKLGEMSEPPCYRSYDILIKKFRQKNVQLTLFENRASPLPYMVLVKDIRILEHAPEENFLKCLEGVARILYEGVTIVVFAEGILGPMTGLLDVQMLL